MVHDDVVNILPGKSQTFRTRIITFLSVAFILFQVITMVWSVIPLIPLRALHAAFVFTLAFLIYDRFSTKHSSPSWLNWTLAIISAVVSVYAAANYARFYTMTSFMNNLDFVLGILAVILVLEACRRAVGWALPIIALVALSYTMYGYLLPGNWGFRGMSLFGIIQSLYAGVGGLWGQISGISATSVTAFLIFGGILSFTGGGQVFIELGQLVAGKSVGGPAKISTISSALFGTISGSAVSNVILSGQFTIPMMKKAGYKSELAGAVESVASSGGSLMPPVMGTGAFVMAQFLGEPYINVAKAAVIPAILYYIGAYAQIHFEAVRMKRFQGIAQSVSEGLWKRLLYLTVPLAILLWLLFENYSETLAVFYAIIASVVIYISVNCLGEKKALVSAFQGLMYSLVGIARGVVMVASILFTAAIIVNLLQQTGIAVKFGMALLELAGNNLAVALIIGMLLSIVLGMGLPAVAAYAIASIVMVGPLQKLGVSPMAAHMFVFYFSVLSSITPPVCPAVYAASSLAQANWVKTGFISVRLAIAGFIVPFMFVYSPLLLLQGGWAAVLLATATSIIGIVFLAAAAEGYCLRPLGYIERIVLAAGGISLIDPGLLTDVVGMILGLTGILIGFFRKQPAIIKAS